MVKRDLHIAIGLTDGEPAVNRYIIASHLTESAYVSHHTALEYYGCASQIVILHVISRKPVSETNLRPAESCRE
jgi:predicted transcriptional regulator of viral defense system